jgi:hypothetical protein
MGTAPADKTGLGWAKPAGNTGQQRPDLRDTSGRDRRFSSTCGKYIFRAAIMGRRSGMDGVQPEVWIRL